MSFFGRIPISKRADRQLQRISIIGFPPVAKRQLRYYNPAFCEKARFGVIESIGKYYEAKRA
jgi:hypothetical protein